MHILDRLNRGARATFWDRRAMAKGCSFAQHPPMEYPPSSPLARCGHRHLLWSAPIGYRHGEAELWQVVHRVTAWPTTDEPERAGVELPPGTRLRHDQSDWVAQGCLGAEELLAWERFLVLDGALIGRCIEFQARNPAMPKVRGAVPAELRPVG